MGMKGSAMGSSKYEGNPEQFNIDYNDRVNFYENLKAEWREILGTPREVYEHLISQEYFKYARREYDTGNYQFRFTHGGLCDIALIYATELKECGT
jgi:hypothetical protein